MGFSKNIANTNNCFGCGVCALACGKKIIEIEQDKAGFYTPIISDETKCTNCGMCVDVCSFHNDGLSVIPQTISSYAAWSNDSEVRKSCSSGGVAFEISKNLLNEGYKVCGVKYNVESNRAEHYIANNIEELIPSIGSKYLQSYTVDGFRQINRKDKFLVIGTPCQIDSLRRIIRKRRCEDNFVLIDFFCHGVPSKLMWDKYVTKVEKEVGKLTFVSWRNKKTGWYDSRAMAIDGKTDDDVVGWLDSYNMLIRGKKSQLYSRKSKGDMFYRLFLSNLCLGKACYKDCKYKYTNSAADIRIGDLWGKTYSNNEDGVSGVLTFSKLGESILRESNITLFSHPIEIVTEGQLKQHISRPLLSKITMFLLHKNYAIDNTLLKTICMTQEYINMVSTYWRIHFKKTR